MAKRHLFPARLSLATIFHPNWSTPTVHRLSNFDTIRLIEKIRYKGKEDNGVLPQMRPQPTRRSRSVGIFVISLLLVGAAFIHHTVDLRLQAEARYRATPAHLSAPAWVPVPQPVPSTLPFPIGENSGVLWNLTNGQLLWADHPHLVEPYASTTKLMTIYLALQRLPLNRVVTISPEAAGTGGSDINMAVGQQYTVKQLLYALMLRSANDSAIALAQSTSGHVSRFVTLMNRTARQLGMTGTTYQDPDGLNPGSRGTAWDLSLIAQTDMKNPLFRKIVDTKETSLPHNPIVQNLNGLLYRDPTVIGVKTGWTTEAGFNLVFAATRMVHGKPVTLLGVIMHGTGGFPPEYQDAEKILNWGYQQVSRSAPHS